ncbi:MAG: hypothetical protein PHU25_13350 [Deltaproteobacteria bacterium]|nr:hypothetical protein [Deltaproteobacteria bacterium]
MGKYDKHNERVEIGNGKCTLGGVTSTCFRCQGTGVDKFGAHCTQCDSNKNWSTFEYYVFLHKELHADD